MPGGPVPINPEEVFQHLHPDVQALACICQREVVLKAKDREGWFINPTKGKQICSVCSRCHKAQRYSVHKLAEICEICSKHYLMSFDEEGERNDRGRCPACTAGAEVHPAFKRAHNFSFS